MIKRTIFAILVCSAFLAEAKADCSFLNELAIKCIDRPLTAEELATFESCNDEEQARVQFAEFITSHEEFTSRIALMARLELLQGTTESDLFFGIRDFDLISFTQLDKKEWALENADKLYKVYHMADDLYAGNIGVEDLYAICFNNFIYDQQNMGVHNFVNSTFSYALGRYPTKVELENAKKMLGGIPVPLFFQIGDSKEDYLRILTHNANFLEEQVNYWYYYFYFEYPSQKELYDILLAINEKNESFGSVDIIRHLIIENPMP